MLCTKSGCRTASRTMWQVLKLSLQQSTTTQDKILPRKQRDKWSIYRKLLHTTSALFLLLTKAPPRTRGYAKLGADVDQLTQPSRRKQQAEVLPAPFPAFSLPCLVGEEGTYVPLVTAALYVCATSGRSWDADSRISLAGSMLPSSLPGREGLAGEVIWAKSKTAFSYRKIFHLVCKNNVYRNAQEELSPSIPEARLESTWQHLVFLWRLISLMFAFGIASGSKS